MPTPKIILKSHWRAKVLAYSPGKQVPHKDRNPLRIRLDSLSDQLVDDDSVESSR